MVTNQIVNLLEDRCNDLFRSMRALAADPQNVDHQGTVYFDARGVLSKFCRYIAAGHKVMAPDPVVMSLVRAHEALAGTAHADMLKEAYTEKLGRTDSAVVEQLPESFRDEYS